MEKKKYMYPLTQVEVWNTREMMTVSEHSSTPIDPGSSSASPAPARDKVF